MKNALTINKFKIAFIIILLLQVLYMLYWGHVKSGFYVDEFFTYDNAHYMSASTPKRVKLYDADYMEYNKWFDLSELKSTLTVEKSNSLFKDGLMHNIKVFTTKPYMALLNYVETIFFEGEINKWSGISLNIIFFVIAQILLYLLAKKNTNNEAAPLLIMALFGFSGIAVSMVAFVRFYMLVNMWMIIFIYLHALMWDENNLKKNIVYEVISITILYLAFKNSPLAIIEGAAVISMFSIALFVRNRKQQFFVYALPIFVCGIAYVVLFTDYMQIIFNTNDVVDGSIGVPTASLINNVIALTPENFVDRSVLAINIINDYLFGHVFISLIFVVFAFIAIIKKRICKERIDDNKSFVYFILGGTIIIFLVASVCLNLGVIRYNSFVYPLISLVIVEIAADIDITKKKGQLIILILALAVCGEIYFTVTIPRVQNSYFEDKAAVKAIQENNGLDNLVVDYLADDRVMYECLVYGDDTTKVMFTRFEDCVFDNAPDVMLVWQSVNWSPEIVDKLQKAGYTVVEQIAQTHESIVFFCQR